MKIQMHKLTLLYFVLLLPLFEPTCFVDIGDGLFPFVDTIYKYTYFIVAGVIIFRYFTMKRLPSLMFWMMLIFEMILMVSSYMAGDTVRVVAWYFINDMPLLIFILCAEYAVNENEFDHFIVALSSLFTLIIAINTITVVIFPEGLYTSNIKLNWNQHWFLGHKNVQLPFFAMALLATGIERFYRKSRKLLIVMISIAITIIGLQSTTSLFAILVGFGYFIYVYNKRGEVGFLLKPMPLFFISIVVSIFIVTGMVSDIFSPLLAIFGKDLTFTGRNTLWPLVITAILDSPVIGNGNNTINLTNLIGYGQAHNFYLDILYRGGVLYLGALIIIVATAFRNLKKVNGSILYCAIMSALLLFFVFFQQEGNHGKMVFFMIIYMAYCAPKFYKSINNVV